MTDGRYCGPEGLYGGNRVVRCADLLGHGLQIETMAANGLVSGSLVPAPPIRRLRDLTPNPGGVGAGRSREIARLEKLLEDAGIKLSSIASELNGVSCRAMLSALIDGERDPKVLANLAQRRLRPKSRCW